MISAGFFDNLWGKITGMDTKNVGINISVGVTKITFVENNSTSAIAISGLLNSGPNPTIITINFTAYQGAGAIYLNDSTAKINISYSSGASLEFRENSSCVKYGGTGANYNNYTCNVTFWWYDAAGSWAIYASILDNFSTQAINKSTNISVSATTGFTMGPTNLTWSTIGAGATNQTASNNPIEMNNTGNQNIGTATSNVSVNATDLVGETSSSLSLYSGNFSVSSFTGGTTCSGAACTECAGSNMSITSGFYANITDANLTKGNYTIDNGDTGQERLYFCLRLAGSELITQSYSTISKGVWTIKI